MKTVRSLVAVSSIAALLSACSSSQLQVTRDNSRFLDSGTIVVSRNLPQALSHSEFASTEMAPLLGFFPPADNFLPADNEPWLKVSKKSNKVSLMIGDRQERTFEASGKVPLAAGRYALQRKDQFPRWYAPDEYFVRRRLNVPAANDPIRFRRGALGKLALYFAPEAPIHSALLCADEVGGIKLEESDLRQLFQELPLGAAVVVTE